MKVPEISQLYPISVEHIRKTIHRFNSDGMASLKPNYGGGRPPTFTEEQRADIIELAQIPPKVFGYPFTHWLLAKLKDAAKQKKILSSVSIETIRVILDEAKIIYQNTKTWKESMDPILKVKKRIEALYKCPPKNGRVICVDEFGPLSLQPYHGKGWFQQRRPKRLGGTYTRPHGVTVSPYVYIPNTYK